MATTLLGGHKTWSMTRDAQGHRDYKIAYLVKGATTDGPATALNTTGLPVVGATWSVDGDSDPYAWCRPDAQVTPYGADGEPNRYFLVEFLFSTRPLKQCQDDEVESPILQPQRVSGSFVRYNEEAYYDRNGARILNSAFEQVRGPLVEFDRNRPQVRIEQNVAALGLATFTPMVDTVNGAPLWGLPARTIKLSNVAWERRFYGTCTIYYTRIFEFDIRYETFDRDLADEGTKVLRGHWVGGGAFWVLDKVNKLVTPSGLTLTYFPGAGFGSLSGSYQYAITAFNGTGETLACTPVAIGALPPPGAVNVDWTPVEGATNYKVWRRPLAPVIDPDSNWSLMAITAAPPWYDPGDPSLADDQTLPTENTTGDLPNPANPTHFQRAKDPKNENIRILLDGAGVPAINTGVVGNIHVERYSESDFTVLGIPLTF